MENDKRIMVRIDEYSLKKLKKLAHKKEVSTSELIREALKKLLKKEGKYLR